ncbi:perilipin-5-like [Dromiciops gliroides]|uniref:perilipin-5-like n=1 Tax=Dromiciops gliroides TaxID=33562 RepID=UPI001CC56D67|nr:perilipin-5-like [Dromiciops gliroides]
MNKPQVPEEKPHSSMEIRLDKGQPSKETNSSSSSGYTSKEESASISGVTKRSVPYEEQIMSEIQKEKQALEEFKATMNKYFPISPDIANIHRCPEGGDSFREDSSSDEGYFTSLGSLPSNVQHLAYKNAMENIRSFKSNIRKLLYQLYEATELTYQSKQGSQDRQNYYKALLELWIKWIRNQSENSDGETQLLERTLGMSQSIALKLQSAFVDLMPKIQDFPSSLQAKLQKACYDMQELHNTFSLSNGFENLDKHHLTQIQVKLIHAQESIEEWYCFLENRIPSGWDVRPFLPL